MSKAQYDRVWNYIESGKAEGAKVVYGGVKRKTRGYWVDPTSELLRYPLRYSIMLTTVASVFADIKPSMRIVREEVHLIC